MTLALFDFDGTITTRETMPDFLRCSISPARLILGQLLLAPLIVGYRLGLVSGTSVRRAIVRFGYTGTTVAALRAHGQEFARNFLPATVRPEMMHRISWHKAQGHKVVVVSGGLDTYLAPWCRQHGLELICSALQEHDGVLTGRYVGEQCVLKEKARRVRERYDLVNFSEIYAYGDTPEDKDLLSLATRRYYCGKEVGAVGGL
ncbi:HAD family hydrolase [Lysobacter avium]|uniref:HAD family hydrolase n=2 Tax=Novilysobacter avium TaxID=2781023 RepID=A0A7S6UKR5_9GAMM|nr:HAD family hydrolase [Lysobacter avium]